MRWKRCSDDRLISSIASQSRPAATISVSAAYWRAQSQSMPPDQSGESWRDAALLLDMALAAEDALSFVADLDERAFLASDPLSKRRHPQARDHRRGCRKGLEILSRDACGNPVAGNDRPAPSPHPWLWRRKA